MPLMSKVSQHSLLKRKRTLSHLTLAFLSGYQSHTVLNFCGLQLRWETATILKKTPLRRRNFSWNFQWVRLCCRANLLVTDSLLPLGRHASPSRDSLGFSLGCASYSKRDKVLYFEVGRKGGNLFNLSKKVWGAGGSCLYYLRGWDRENRG